MKIVWLAWLLNLLFDVNANISFPAEVREVKSVDSSGINQRPTKEKRILYGNEDENLINHRPGFSPPIKYTYSSEEEPQERNHHYPTTGYYNQNSRIHGQQPFSGWSGGAGAFGQGIISCNVCSPSTFHFTPDCCSQGNYQCCNSGHGGHGWSQGGGYSHHGHHGASGYGQTQLHQLTGAGYGYGQQQGHGISSSIWPSTSSLNFLPSFRGYGVFGKRKSGFCPIQLEAVPRCSLECRDDSECSGRRKCCSFGCASLCSDPYSPRDSLPYTGSFAIPPEDKGSTGLTKPGTCYRPYNQNAGYYFDRADSETNSNEEPKRKKREANDLQLSSFGDARNFGNKPHQGSSGSFGHGYGGGYGGHGHNGWSGNSGPRSCHKDFECQGNQKCCSGFCLTPYFAG